MRFCACLAFVALLAGCSYSVEGSGSPPPQTEPNPAPAPAVDEITEGEAKTPPPLTASDIKGVSVVIDGITQAIGEGIATISNGQLSLTLRRRGDVNLTHSVVFLSIDHIGMGCSRRDDHYTQSLSYYPSSLDPQTGDPQYASPLSLRCGMNILELDKNRNGRVVGIYDGELVREWGSATNPIRVRAIIKFNVPMPATE